MPTPDYLSLLHFTQKYASLLALSNNEKVRYNARHYTLIVLLNGNNG